MTIIAYKDTEHDPKSEAAQRHSPSLGSAARTRLASHGILREVNAVVETSWL